MEKEVLSRGAEESELESLRALVRQQQEWIGKLEEKLAKQEKRIEELEAELKASKNLKRKPKLSASRLNEKPKSLRKRGFPKRSKKGDFKVDEERIIEPPEGEDTRRFNGYRDYDVQELELRRQNIRFRLAEYVKEDGTTVVGQLPLEYKGGHLGPKLRGYILYQHYQCRVHQALIGRG